MPDWRNIKAGAERVLSLARPGRQIAVFDLETSGLGKKARIIQFSGILWKVGEDLSLTEAEENSRIDLYINPEMEIEEKITELTGITNEMLHAARPLAEEWNTIQDFLGRADVWAGHNLLRFDVEVLSNESERTRLPCVSRPVLDTMNMAGDFLKKGTDVANFKLVSLFEYYFPGEPCTYHNSFEDARAESMLLNRLLQEYKEFSENEKVSESPASLENLNVLRASLFINPHQGSMKRIRLLLSEGELGDVYYDIMTKRWSCKTTASAKKLFARLDMQGIEKQVLDRFGYQTMDDLAEDWESKRREQGRQSKWKEYRKNFMEVLREVFQIPRWDIRDVDEYESEFSPSFRLDSVFSLAVSFRLDGKMGTFSTALYAIFGETPDSSGARVSLMKHHTGNIRLGKDPDEQEKCLSGMRSLVREMVPAYRYFQAKVADLSECHAAVLTDDMIFPVAQAVGRGSAEGVSDRVYRILQKRKKTFSALDAFESVILDTVRFSSPENQEEIAGANAVFFSSLCRAVRRTA